MKNKITELNEKHLSPFLRSPLLELSSLFPKRDLGLLHESDLNADLLCELQTSLFKSINSDVKKRFVCQDLLPQDERYYEQIIFEDHIIPTRKNSWHDFFNGLIWLRFPLTKTYLNSLHMSEIEQNGLNPRTRVRNHITHFDECGVVLFIQGNDLYKNLDNAFKQQNWTYIFNDLRELWYTSICPVIFGHANLEMLLSPFIGLTGKVLLIEVNAELGKMPFSFNTQLNQCLRLDQILVSCLQEKKTLNEVKPFYPLPLLGVPNWHWAEQNTEFYANEAYFMPKRQRDTGA